MTAPIENVFEKFETDLKEAVTFMDSESRRAAKLAVIAALEFVHAHEQLTSQNLHRPFYALVAALDDLEVGRVTPMLEPVQVDHRSPDSVVKNEAQAYACFCVDLLMNLGDSVERACRAVADIWARHEISFGGKYDTPHWRTIKHWRDGISKLSAQHPRRAILEELRKGAAANPQEYMGKEKRGFVLALLDRNLTVMGSKAALE